MTNRSPKSKGPDDPAAASRRVVVRCPACGTKNRVERGRAARATPRCARCHADLSIPPVQTSALTVTDATFAQTVERSPIPVLLAFQSRHCIHCQRLQPVIELVATDVSDRLRVATLDIDENRATATRYAVSATPTMLILDRGRELERVEGALSEDQMRYRLYRYLDA